MNAGGAPTTEQWNAGWQLDPASHRSAGRCRYLSGQVWCERNDGHEGAHGSEPMLSTAPPLAHRDRPGVPGWRLDNVSYRADGACRWALAGEWCPLIAGHHGEHVRTSR